MMSRIGLLALAGVAVAWWWQRRSETTRAAADAADRGEVIFRNTPEPTGAF